MSLLVTNRTAPAAVDVPMCAAPVDAVGEALVLEVLRSGQIAAGEKVEAFEAACATMAGTTHAVAVSNGTASLEVLLEGLGIGPGDEVITTSFTFAATVAAIVRSGATARLVDIGVDHTLDVDAVEAAIGPRTAAILPVHLYGQPADLGRLASLCSRHGLALIEDAAQAHGARVADRPVGGWGHGSFSFYATKNVSCGEGGVATTNDAQLARTLRLLRNQGMDRRHHHEIVGQNLRMSELHAALGLASISRLDAINAARQNNAVALAVGLTDERAISLPKSMPGRTHAWHQFTILTPDRDALAADLAAVGVATGKHYPMPVQEQPAFRNRADVVADRCPRARNVSRHCLSLPVHDQLSAAQIDHVIAATRNALRADS